MPNWVHNDMTITGPAEEIARFKQTCIRPNYWDDDEKPFFDFNELIPMPMVLEGTESSSVVGEALIALGRADLAPEWLISALEKTETPRHEPDAKDLAKAQHSIMAFEQTGACNWYDWKCKNWGTKWNSCRFSEGEDEEGRYAISFDTAWSPPIPIWEKLGEMFPSLDIAISVGEEMGNFAYEGGIRGGKLELREGPVVWRELPPTDKPTSLDVG